MESEFVVPSACVLDTRKKLVAAARWQADRLVAVGDNPSMNAKRNSYTATGYTVVQGR